MVQLMYLVKQRAGGGHLSQIRLQGVDGLRIRVVFLMTPMKERDTFNESWSGCYRIVREKCCVY